MERVIRFLLKNWWLLILVFLLVPVIVNGLMKPFWAWSPFKPEGDVNSWINFWGNYTGGVLGALIGGIVAYYIVKIQINAQRKSEKDKYIFDIQMNILRTIMENRSYFIGNQILSNDLVKALNLIEIDFNDHPNVIAAWKILNSTLSTGINNEVSHEIITNFTNNKNDQFINMIFEIGSSLNLKIDRKSIINSMYLPDSYFKSIEEQQKLKQKIEGLLDGTTNLSVEVKKIQRKS